MTLIESYNLFKKNFYIVAIDYDNTLTIDPENLGTDSVPMRTDLINMLKKFKESDSRIKYILWTCRNGELLSNALKRCDDVGLEFNAVNDNIIEMNEFFTCPSRKITYDLLIDDKNISLNEILLYKESLLHQAIKGAL